MVRRFHKLMTHSSTQISSKSFSADERVSAFSVCKIKKFQVKSFKKSDPFPVELSFWEVILRSDSELFSTIDWAELIAFSVFSFESRFTASLPIMVNSINRLQIVYFIFISANLFFVSCEDRTFTQCKLPFSFSPFHLCCWFIWADFNQFGLISLLILKLNLTTNSKKLTRLLFVNLRQRTKWNGQKRRSSDQQMWFEIRLSSIPWRGSRANTQIQ